MALWVSRRFPGIFPPLPTVGAKGKGCVGTMCCSLHREADTTQQQHTGIMCDLCNGSGWLICDFCKGQKTNVKSKSSRFYRRCPYCKAVGLVLCPKCKVFKCVTFPDFSDSRA